VSVRNHNPTSPKSDRVPRAPPPLERAAVTVSVTLAAGEAPTAFEQLSE
jgi:hypothetical protein